MLRDLSTASILVMGGAALAVAILHAFEVAIWGRSLPSSCGLAGQQVWQVVFDECYDELWP